MSIIRDWMGFYQFKLRSNIMQDYYINRLHALANAVQKMALLLKRTLADHK